MASPKTQKITAHPYWVHADNADQAAVIAVCKAIAAEDFEQDFEVNGIPHLITNGKWNQARDALTGRIYKVRMDNHPDVIDTKKKTARAAALGLPPEQGLGESMCFAFYPAKMAALVTYNHNGARHTSLAPALQAAGLVAPAFLTPVVRDDLVERLKDSTFVKDVEIGFVASPETRKALAKNASVKAAVTMLDIIDGEVITIKVGIGRKKRKKGLVPSVLRGIANTLDGTKQLTKFQANYSTAIGGDLEFLDLMGAVHAFDFQVPVDGRSFDHSKCQSRLLDIFDDKALPVLNSKSTA